MREAALSELGSAPRLGVDSCAGASETRLTAGTNRRALIDELTVSVGECCVQMCLQLQLCADNKQAGLPS